MTKKCVMRELRRYSLLENTFLFFKFFEVNLLICQIERINKNISNFRQKLRSLANFPKGESAIYFEKMYIYVYKVSYCDKGKMKDSKNFDVA